ncbi:hypothetical protein ABID08_000687 [Rhizobium binae]|uniref:Uncharacterized protein n=1 Tax=Rhizobium binae TaxID=1138190 RepID=A0ABV2MA59_9HYPH
MMILPHSIAVATGLNQQAHKDRIEQLLSI